MKTTATMILAVSMLATRAQAAEDCADLQAAVAKTYGFRPATLEPNERAAKSKAMDDFWNTAEAKGKAWVPCLKAALKDSKADPFFRFDGSQLLLKLDNSDDAKRIQVDAFRTVNFDDVQLRTWVTELTHLGYEGIDTSPAAARLFALKAPTFNDPKHAQLMGKTAMLLFLYGSMDERFATPGLARALAGPLDASTRAETLFLLGAQDTPESRAALKTLSPGTIPEDMKKDVDAYLKGKPFITPRTPAKLKRADVLAALHGVDQLNLERLGRLLDDDKESPRDLLAVLRPEDAPLVRKARRLAAAFCNESGANYYNQLSDLLSGLQK